MGKEFKNLFLFYTSYQWFNRISTAILPTIFLASNLTLQEMVFGIALCFTAQSLLLLFVRKLSSKLSWKIALICVAIYICLIISIKSPLQFYLGSSINGFALFFFFVVYNIAHFANTPKRKRGHSSALMFAIPSAIGVVAPIIAGFFAQLNVTYLWAISLASFILSFSFINRQEDFKVNIDIRKSLNSIEATRALIFIEGVWEALIFAVIPIYTLYFIQKPLNYGVFASYLAVLSVIANLTLGRLTDKLQKRSVFLFPLTIIMGVATTLFAVFPQNLTYWIIMTGVIQFLLPLFWNLTMAMVVDSHANLKLAIPGREILLAAGRTLGASFVIVSLCLEPYPHYIFILLGIIMFAFTGVLYYNKHLTKRHSYL
ncbi:MAG TPA: hypothetical protein VG965_05835 [Patescibacteria group bacterium]|nr:hypothetical protein [Patescibacteria group bacterium]